MNVRKSGKTPSSGVINSGVINSGVINSGVMNSEERKLIESIFNFLLLVSYEKFESRDSNVPIISISKILQLSDGLLASGQSIDDFLLPALKCIVEDVFCYRSTCYQKF